MVLNLPVGLSYAIRSFSVSIIKYSFSCSWESKDLYIILVLVVGPLAAFNSWAIMSILFLYLWIYLDATERAEYMQDEYIEYWHNPSLT